MQFDLIQPKVGSDDITCTWLDLGFVLEVSSLLVAWDVTSDAMFNIIVFIRGGESS